MTKVQQLFYWEIWIPIVSLPKKSQVSLLVAVTLLGILKAKQKLLVSFNSDMQDVIDFKKFSRLKMCRASEANS